jgi:hypothetical protein
MLSVTEFYQAFPLFAKSIQIVTHTSMSQR